MNPIKMLPPVIRVTNKNTPIAIPIVLIKNHIADKIFFMFTRLSELTE